MRHGHLGDDPADTGKKREVSRGILRHWSMPTTSDDELMGTEPVERMQSLLDAALRRKPAQEARIAGAVRALSPFSASMGACVARTAQAFVRRSSFDRPLYPAVIRAFAEDDGPRAAPEIERALLTEDSGGLSTLSAACFIGSGKIADALARVAGCRHPHLALAAEMARIARSESGGERIASLAPKIKESHRIALCVEVFVPLLRHSALPLSIAPALSVLRDAERHLGRWLVFAEVAARAGDTEPLAQARERADSGPPSARPAWALVAWALRSNGATPDIRPTVDLVSRLSDRPSADRDPTFLYRLAEARSASVRPMLESIARTPLRADGAIRAALYLARDHGRDDLRDALRAISRNDRQDALRGLAAACLYDLGERAEAVELADTLVQSRKLETLCWGALLRAATSKGVGRVVSESNYRRVQLGWIE